MLTNFKLIFKFTTELKIRENNLGIGQDEHTFDCIEYYYRFLGFIDFFIALLFYIIVSRLTQLRILLSILVERSKCLFAFA